MRITAVHPSGLREQFTLPDDYTFTRLRRGLDQIWGLPPDTTVCRNGISVTSDEPLADGDVISFIRPPGQKGIGQVFTLDEVAAKLRLSLPQIQQWIKDGLSVYEGEDGTKLVTETEVDLFLRQKGASQISRVATAVAATSAALVVEQKQLESAENRCGPGEKRRFYWRGKFAGFGKQKSPFDLCKALWDERTNSPAAERLIADVLREVWSETRATIVNLKEAIQRVRRAFREADLAIGIAYDKELIWFEPDTE